MKQDQIVQYYDSCEVDYRLLWDLNHSHAMHAGYWDSRTKNLRDALRRENEVLAEKASIKKEDRVLDAGCGVGGSSLFLASEYGCEVVGITLSQKQAFKATGKAQERGLYPRVSFAVMDYSHTSFPDHSFDVVWAIESVCHAPDKHAFVKEAARLLKPGGRLIVADGFATQEAYSGQDERRMARWLRGWGVSQLETVVRFKNYLVQEGFEKSTFDDITSHVLPSSRRLYWYSWPGIALSKLGQLVGCRTSMQTENLQGARCQYQTLKKALWFYGIFYAEKNKFTS